MKKVIDILAKKGSNVISVSPEAKIISALQIMQEKNIGSVVVIQEGKYMGILTERDYARKVILLDKNSSETSVAEIMTTDLPLIDRTTSLESCMVIMSEKNIRYLPVVEEGELMGIISINDLIRSTIQNHLEKHDKQLGRILLECQQDKIKFLQSLLGHANHLGIHQIALAILVLTHSQFFHLAILLKLARMLLQQGLIFLVVFSFISPLL